MPLGMKQALSGDAKARPVPALLKTQQQTQCALKSRWIMCIQAKKCLSGPRARPSSDGAASSRATPGTGQGRTQEGDALPAGWWGQASTGHVPGDSQRLGASEAAIKMLGSCLCIWPVGFTTYHFLLVWDFTCYFPLVWDF